MSAWQPTESLLRALLVGVGGLAWAVAVGEPAVLVIAAPLLVLAVPAVCARPRTRPGIEVDVDHGTLSEGQGTVVRLSVHDDGDVEQITRVAAPEQFVAVRPSRGCVAAAYRSGEDAADLVVSPRRWGARTIGVERVALTSAWAGYRWGPVVLPGRQVRVLPAPPPLASRAEQARPQGLVGAHRSSRTGSGTELAGIRAFQPGDRLRRIHWPVSVRTGALHVTTTRAEQDAGLLLVVDLLAEHGTSGGVGGQESSLDVTVRAAAALAELAAHRGDRVALRPVGGRGSTVPAGSGRRHLRRVLAALAEVSPGEAPYDDLSRLELRVGAGTTVVLFSPLLADAVATTAATLVRRGVPTVVIDTLPPDAEPDLGDRDPVIASIAWRMRRLEREQVRTALDTIGCPVLAWHGRDTIDDVFRSLARFADQPRVRR